MSEWLRKCSHQKNPTWKRHIEIGNVREESTRLLVGICSEQNLPSLNHSGRGFHQRNLGIVVELRRLVICHNDEMRTK